MRLARLLAFSCLLALFFASAPAQAQWCHDIDQTYWCGDPSDCEGVCSQPGADCTMECSRFGTWTTCGGGSTTDSDSDGIPNSSDNCVCSSNANQADCDQDGMGDTCDAVDEKWVPVNTLTYCDWDMDWHFGYGEVEKWGTRRYRELCTNTYCNNSEKMDDSKCYGIFDAEDCCIESYGSATCSTDNQCPADTCPF
jgi:hypothetical protein